MNTLAVTMVDRSDRSHTLKYRLYDSDLTRKWLAVTAGCLADSAEIKTVFYNHLDFADLAEQIRSLIDDINLGSDRKIHCAKDIDRQELNRLHHEMELFLDSNLKEEYPYLVQKFIRLNELIHQCEQAAANTANQGSSFSCMYSYPGRGHHQLQQRDLLMLDTEMRWGGLYLGYATVGKDWFSVYMDRDIQLIKQQQVTIQRQFNAETLLCFCAGLPPHGHTSRFMDWTRGLDSEVRELIPLDDVAGLRLGKLRLGDIIIDHQFLALDPDPWHWQAYGHPCRTRWNRLVFSQMRSIKSIALI